MIKAEVLVRSRIHLPRTDAGKEDNMLNIKTEMENNKLLVTLTGRLDTMTAPDLEKELEKSLDSASSLVLDLTELEYISSAGLRILLFAQKSMSGKEGMKLKGVNDTVQEILDVTGFSDILTIE